MFIVPLLLLSKAWCAEWSADDPLDRAMLPPVFEYTQPNTVWEMLLANSGLYSVSNFVLLVVILAFTAIAMAVTVIVVDSNQSLGPGNHRKWKTRLLVFYSAFSAFQVLRVFWDARDPQMSRLREELLDVTRTLDYKIRERPKWPWRAHRSTTFQKTMKMVVGEPTGGTVCVGDREIKRYADPLKTLMAYWWDVEGDGMRPDDMLLAVPIDLSSFELVWDRWTDGCRLFKLEERKLPFISPQLLTNLINAIFMFTFHLRRHTIHASIAEDLDYMFKSSLVVLEILAKKRIAAAVSAVKAPVNPVMRKVPVIPSGSVMDWPEEGYSFVHMLSLIADYKVDEERKQPVMPPTGVPLPVDADFLLCRVETPSHHGIRLSPHATLPADGRIVDLVTLLQWLHERPFSVTIKYRLLVNLKKSIDEFNLFLFHR